MNRQLIFRNWGRSDKVRVEKDTELRRKSSESGEIITIRILYLSSLLFYIVVFIVTASPRGVKSTHRPESPS